MADRTKPTAQAAGNQNLISKVNTVKDLFGAHPVDVISPIDSGSDALAQLAELFTVIKEAVAESNETRVRLLADLGVYVASDIANYLDCAHGDFIQRLRDAGMNTGGAA